jgi:hypothetical protein
VSTLGSLALSAWWLGHRQFGTEEHPEPSLAVLPLVEHALNFLGVVVVPDE